MPPFWEPKTSIAINRRNDTWVEGGVSGEEHASYLGRPLGRRQFVIVVAAVLLGATLLLGRAFALQIVYGGYYRDLAEGNRLRVETVQAPRGLLFDQYGQALTENAPRLSVALVPHDVPREDGERHRIFSEASDVSHIPREAFEAAWNELPKDRRVTFDPVIVAGDMGATERLRFQLAVDRWPGLAVVTVPERRIAESHNQEQNLAHVVGYVGRVTDGDLQKDKAGRYATTDIIGKSGLEATYETLLKGKNGRREVEVNALGQEQKTYAEVAPEAGAHLWLTLDADLQVVAAESLKRAMDRAHVTKGSLVVMDPNNGAVLSLVSYPTFDVNAFNHGLSSAEYRALIENPDHPLFNRVVQGLFPSGSTLKPVVAAAALAEHVVSPTTTVLSNGGIRIGQWFFPDWKGGGHGVTDVRKALAESVNTFFYIVGGGYQDIKGLGMEKLHWWATQFGLGKPTGIDLPHEADGFFPTEAWKEETKHEQWYIGDTYHVSIGQGDVLVTPLQVANYTAAFANGGTLYVPHVLSEVVSADGKVRQSVEVKTLATQVAPSDVLQVVREGMRQAVTDGSARFLGDLPIAAAGKTGTAQVGGDANTHAWFTGFAPYDHPQLVVTVLLENAGEGSSFAVPVAKDILKWWADNRIEVPQAPQ